MCSPCVFRALQIYSPSSERSTDGMVSSPLRMTAFEPIRFPGPPDKHHIIRQNSRSQEGIVYIMWEYLTGRPYWKLNIFINKQCFPWFQGRTCSAIHTLVGPKTTLFSTNQILSIGQRKQKGVGLHLSFFGSLVKNNCIQWALVTYFQSSNLKSIL